MTDSNTKVNGNAQLPVYDDAKTAGRFGYRDCSPNKIQWMNKPVVFLFVFCVAAFGESLLVNGLVGTSISSWETRFSLSSSETAISIALYELSGIPVLLVLGYFGSRLHRPRWIAVGSLTMAVGAVVMTMPHFTTGVYKYSDDAYRTVCQGHNGSVMCSDDSESVANLKMNLYVFIAGMLVISFGSIPLFVLGIPCLTDSTTPEKAAFYLGIFYALSVLGPAVAYIGGGSLLEIFTDFYSVSSESLTIDTDDPRWVGAWWIGFLVAALILLITIFPFAAYPNYLPGSPPTQSRESSVIPEIAASNTHNANHVTIENDDITAVQPAFSGSCKEFPAAMKDMFTNWTFVFCVLSAVGDGLLVSGFATFGPKYVENQFSVSSTFGGIIFGALVVPGGAGGNVIGGWIVKRWKLTCGQMLKMYTITSLLGLLSISMFFIQCDNPPFSGVTVSTSGPEQTSAINGITYFELTMPCNAECTCTRDYYEPVCGTDDVIYFSPCYAGCLSQHTETEETYVNCSCVQNPRPEVTSGFCDAGDCKLLPLFCVLLLLGMLLIFSGEMLQLNILLRCVEPNKRPLAIGLEWIVVRLIGSFPATLIFGAALDKSCVLWEETCGETGSCLYYNNHQMAWYMMLVAGISKLSAVIFSAIAWKVYPGDQKVGQELNKDYLPETVSGIPNMAYSASSTNVTASIDSPKNGSSVNLETSL